MSAVRLSNPVSGSSTASRRCSRSEPAMAPERIATAITRPNGNTTSVGSSATVAGSTATVEPSMSTQM